MSGLICDTCFATVEGEFMSRHMERHQQEQTEKAEVSATLGMLVEIICPNAATLLKEHGIEELSTPATTKVEFAKSVLDMGRQGALEGHS